MGLIDKVAIRRQIQDMMGDYMTTKVHLRAGEVEFTFESDAPLAVSDVKDFLAQVQEMAQSVLPSKVSPLPQSNNGGVAETLLLEDSTLKLHINSIAERLSASSGSEVALAAAAFIQIVEGKQNFTRRELLDAMKLATNVYNQNMSSNLTAILKKMIGSKLNQLANDSYALKGDELKELRGKLTD